MHACFPRRPAALACLAAVVLAWGAGTGDSLAQTVSAGDGRLALEARQMTEPMSLVDAVAMTLGRHPRIAQALAAVGRGRADVDAARSVWLPTITYQGSLGPDSTSSSGNWEFNEGPIGGGITVQQLLWDFGRSRGQVGAASATEQQRRHELAATADELAEQAALAFIEVSRHEALLRDTGRHVQSLEQLRELIRLRADAGLSDRSDLLLAGVRVESARAEQIQVRTAHRSAVIELGNLTGAVAPRYLDPAGLIAGFPPGDEAPDLDNLPLVAAARAAERATESRIDGLRAERLPRLGLQVGYDRRHYSGFDATVRPDNSLTALVTVTGELHRGSLRHELAGALEDRRAARAVRDNVVLEARRRILAARQQIEGGEARIEAYRAQEEHAARTSEIFLEEYKLGKRSLSDLLSAELEIYRAASARIGAEHDVMRARVQHEAAVGSLRRSLGLAVLQQEEIAAP